MKKTVKKGFTLVELLVVIAILAILATVSVVGYTAFIERANLAIDQDTGNQLSHFLDNMRADSTSKYYDTPITPENVWEVIDAALEENGTLTDLVPKTEGYHYFFKFDKNEAGEYKDGEIVVAKKADIITKATKGFFAARAIDPATDEYGVGFFTAEDAEGNEILYFFLDTKGSDLAVIINALQNVPVKGWDRIEGETSKDKLKNVMQAVEGAKNETNGKADYSEQLQDTRFATSEGYIATNENANKNIIFVEENASIGGTVTIVKTTENNNEPSIIDTAPLAPDSNTTITVPAGTKVSEGALDVEEDKKDSVTVIVKTDSLDNVTKSVESGFTNSTVKIEVDNDNNSYEVEVTTTTNTETGATTTTTVIVKVDTEGNKTDTGHELGTGLFPMTKFNIEAIENGEYTDVKTGDAKLVYLSIDKNKISFDISGVEGKEGNPVSKGKVKWTVVEVKADKNETPITGDLSSYASFDETGVLTIQQDKLIDEIAIQAKAELPYEDGQYASNTYTVRLVRPTNVTGLTLGGKSLDEGFVELGNSYSNDGQTKENSVFTLGSIDKRKVEYNHPGYGSTYTVTVTQNIALKADNADFTYDGYNIKLNHTTTTNEEGETITVERYEIQNAKITVKVGDFFEKAYNVTLYDQCQLAYTKTDSTIRYLGNGGSALNTIKIFNRNESVDIPDGAQLYVFSGTGDAPKYPCKSNKFTVVPPMTPEKDPKTVYTVSTDKDGNTTIIFGDGVTSESVGWKIAWAVKSGDEYEIVSDMWDIRAVPAVNLVNGSNPSSVISTDPFTGHKGVHIHSKDNCQVDSKGAHVTTEKNIVLLEDYYFTDRQYLTLKNSTLYGNLFTLDVTKGRNNTTGIIELISSTLKDTKVIAAEYSTTNDAWYKALGAIGVCHLYDIEYSAAAVRVYGTKSTIDNCYISGARAPLRIEVSGTTVKDTVLFGGAYANLNTENSITINLENVITVNQSKYWVDDKWVDAKLFGFGIFAASATQTITLNISGDKGLMQFNFIENSDDVLERAYSDIKNNIADANGLIGDFTYTVNDNNNKVKYFSINIIEDKAESADQGGTNVNITIGGTKKLPDYHSKGSKQKGYKEYLIGVSFNNNLITEVTASDPNDRTDAQKKFYNHYGFDFTIQNFFIEASKYHPENIGKPGNYKLEYKD